MWEEESLLRNRARLNDRLTMWPDTKSVGIASTKSCSLNSRCLELLARWWCDKNPEGPCVIPITVLRDEARCSQKKCLELVWPLGVEVLLYSPQKTVSMQYTQSTPIGYNSQAKNRLACSIPWPGRLLARDHGTSRTCCTGQSGRMGAEENDDAPDSPLDGGVKCTEGYLMQCSCCISFYCTMFFQQKTITMIRPLKK